MESDSRGTEPSLPSFKKPRQRRRSSKPAFDLERTLELLSIQSRDTPEVVSSRLRNEEKKADHERWNHGVVLFAVLIGLTAIGGACLFVALRPGPSEDKKWAMSVLASIVSAGVGYLGGRASKPD